MEQEAIKPEGQWRRDRHHGWHAESHFERQWNGTDWTGRRQAGRPDIADSDG